jgi:hypothetical protein
MAIVDAQRLNRFMKEPVWSAAMYEEAQDILDGLESTLADALNTKITPVPWRDSSAVILESGLVNTTYPVFSVSSVDGVTVPSGDPLPAGWEISNHNLRRVAAVPTFDLMTGWGYGAGRVQGVGVVDVSYMAGLGNLPALRLLLLRKGKTIMDNRFDDTVVARDLDTSSPPPVPKEDFTEDELRPLGKYRNIVNWR